MVIHARSIYQLTMLACDVMSNRPRNREIRLAEFNTCKFITNSVGQHYVSHFKRTYRLTSPNTVFVSRMSMFCPLKM